MKRIPTKHILWIQVFAALFAAVIALICFFTPLTSLKANPNASGLFEDYLTYAAAAKSKDVKDEKKLEALEKEFEGYSDLLFPEVEVDEDAEIEDVEDLEALLKGKPVEIKVSMADILFNTVDMVKIIIRVGQIESLKSGTTVNLETLKKVSEADYSELNTKSLGLAYYFSSFMYDAAATAVGGANEVVTTGNESKAVADILGFFINIALLIVVFILYTIAAVVGILTLIGMIGHITAPEGYYEASSKRTSSLLTNLLFATLLGSVASNGGGLASGGVLVLISAIIVLGANAAAAYLKKNSPAQLKYLITTHAIGLISAIGLVIAFACSTSAGIGNWLISNEAIEKMTEAVTKLGLNLKDSKSRLDSYKLMGAMFFALEKVFSLVLISILIQVVVNSVLLTENKKASYKNNPIYQGVIALLIVMLPFLLTKFLIKIALPSMTTLVLSWVGAGIFLAAQVMRGWAYAKFTDISIAEKALLLAGCPDGDKKEEAAAPAAEEVAPTEEN